GLRPGLRIHRRRGLRKSARRGLRAACPCEHYERGEPEHPAVVHGRASCAAAVNWQLFYSPRTRSITRTLVSFSSPHGTPRSQPVPGLCDLRGSAIVYNACMPFRGQQGGNNNPKRGRTPPPEDTFEEASFLKALGEKQKHVTVKLMDGQTVRGWIEYYDRN